MDNFLDFSEDVELSASSNAPDGVWRFEYLGFERDNHAPDQYDDRSYPRALMKLKIFANGEEFLVTERFPMLESKQWKIANFFQSIGSAPNPVTGKVKPLWQSGVGKRGWVKLEQITMDSGKKWQTKTFLKPDSAEIPKDGQGSASTDEEAW